MSINSTVTIHSGSIAYTERPPISIDLSVTDVIRSGNLISCTITNASVNALGGASHFGYPFTVYAQLDNGEIVELWSKGSSPSQWNSGAYNLSEHKVVSSINTGTSATFKILLNAGCTCTGHGSSQIVWQSNVSAPPAAVIVTFNLNGGTRTGGGQLIQSVPIGGSATEPVCERIGYRFVGWDKPLSNITSDTTITAQWERLQYTVTFNLDGGTRTGGGELNQTVYYGEDATPPTCQRTQCNFVRWEGSYTNVTSNRTILAIWDYIIIYDISELEYITIPQQIKHKNVNLILSSINLTSERPGYEHIGWSTSTGGTSQYALGDTYTSNAPLTLYPAWEMSKQTFTVKFDLRGGTSSGGGELIQVVQYGHSAIPPSNVKKYNKRFSGWLGNYSYITQDCTIYALWDSSPLWIFTGTEWVPFAD